MNFSDIYKKVLENRAQNGSSNAAPSGAAVRPVTRNYYSLPELWTDEQKLYDNAMSLKGRLQEQETGLKTLTSSIQDDDLILNFMTNRLNSMAEQYKTQPSQELADTYQAEYTKYTELQQKNRTNRLQYALSSDQYETTRKAYNQAVTAYQDYVTDQQSKFDTWRSTIRDSATVKAQLDSVRDEIKSLQREDAAGSALALIGNAAQNALVSSSGFAVPGQTYTPQNTSAIKRMQDWEKLLQEEYEWSQYFQYADLKNAEDFADKSQYVSTSNGNSLQKYGDIAYEIINGNDDAWKQVSIAQSFGKLSDDEVSRMESYSFMTDEEVANYNYCYATGGKTAAEAYLDRIQEELNGRKAGKMFEGLEGKTGKEMLFGIAAGLDQANSGLKNILNTEDEYIPLSSLQIASGKVREDLSDIDLKWYNVKDKAWQDQKIFGSSLGQAGYDSVTTAANMAPSILTSVVVGMLNPVAGEIAGNAMMGASAAGNAYQEKLNLGYSEDQARTYGLLIGTSEALLGKALGGISKLGGGNISKAVLKNIGKVDNVFAKFAQSAGGKILLNAGSEAMEEGLQTVLEPFLWEAVSGEETDVNWEDALYSSLLGFVSGGAFEGVDTITNSVKQNGKQTQGKAPQAAGLTFQEEIQKQVAENLGRENPAQTGTVGAARLDNPQVQIDDATWQQGQRLASVTGRNLRFYEGREGEYGYYDPQTKEICVNTKGGDVLAQVFSHEMTHSLEEAGVYDKLSQVVLSRMQATGIDLDTAREDKRQQYARQGKQLQTTAAVDQELVAEYVSRHLLTDEESIVSLVKEDRTLGQRILGFFDNILAKLGNKNAQERAFLSKARDIYAKALQQTQGQAQAQVQPATMAAETAATEASQTAEPENEADGLRQWAEEAYARGDITDAEYDGIMDEYERYEEERRTAGERQYSVGTAELSTDVAHSKNKEGVSSGNPQVKGNYSNISLANDPTPYTYSFLISQPDMNVVGLPELSAIRNDAGKIDTAKVVAEGLKNALSVGTKRDGKIYVENQYSGRLLRVDVSAIRHGLNGKSNRLITNARLGSRIGDVVRNAIPINALHNTSANADGTYAMAAYATDEAGREIVAIVTVEQQSGNVVGVDAFDVTHAVSGRQKRSEQADTKSQGINPIKLTSKIRIADLIDTVNSTYRSILSEDVLKAIGEKKPIGGHYSDRVKFSLSDGDGRSQEHDADTVTKKDVARDLQAILKKGGSAQDLKQYVAQLERSGRKTEQRGASAEQKPGAAEQILQKAKQQGVSVEQYLRENAELYDVDGHWNRDARKALELEKAGRQYSVSENGEADAGTESQDVRSAMPRKAKDYLKRVERELLWAIADKLSVPKLAGREYLQPIIQELSDEYLREGTISQETKDLLFEKAYAQGVIVDAEFYNQYKEIKDHLRNTPVTISDRDKADIADFKDFRKRAFGTLKIVNEGGLPVDTAYQELHSMAPELFPESITHPADQLVRMYDASRSIQVTEKTVQDYYGEHEPEYRRWAKADFETVIADATGELRTVKRFVDEKAAKEKQDAPVTESEAMEAYKELKAARRTYERAAAKNLLSEHDQMQVGRLLRHEMELEHLDPKKDNVKGITAVFEAKQEYERLSKLVSEYKQHLRGEAKKTADGFLQTANDWKDKKMGIAYSRETMELNIYDIIQDKALAQQIIDKYFTPVHKGEAAATRFKNDYRDRVRALELSRKVEKGNLVSEAHAVQLLGEAEDNIRMLENVRGRIKNRDGKNLSEWRAVVQTLWEENPNLDQEKIQRAVKEFRHIYDGLFQQMNQVRVANGYEPVNYRNGYFPHFQPGDSDSILAQFGRALGIDTRIDALPTTINGLTHTFKPGIQWFGNAQERLGFNTAYDAVEGFDKYIEGVSSVIHQTGNIQNLRALASQIRYRTSDEGIREQVDAIQERPGLSDEEKQQLIQEIYAHGKFTLSNFVTELDEYTNLLANKKSRYDRAIEAAMGRRVYSFLKAWEARVGANMIAGNLTSALTNFIPLTQAGAQMDRFALLGGMISTLNSYRSDDGIVNQSTFLTNRRGSDPLVQTWAQKASGKLSWLMESIDGFVSGSIVRGAYAQNLKRGLSQAEAMDQADAFAASVMGDRSKGAMPTMLQATNPLFKAFTQFQLEVNNQFSEVFTDIPRRYKEKGLATLAWVLLKYFLGAWIYNELYEELIGRRPALDPIGILCQGYDDLQNDGFGAAGANLMTGILEQLPFSSGLTLIGVELDGGRIPASSAVPDLTAIWDAATTEGWSAEKRWKEVQDELNKLAYVITPFGGNQVSKLWKGVKAYVQGGSYNVDAEGNDILQYPVYRDDTEDAFWSIVKAAFLGKSSLDTAQEWVDEGFNSLSAKQTAAYQDMMEVGVKDRDAFGLIRDLEAAVKTETQSRDAVQRDVLRGSSVSGEGKAIVYYGLMATDKERELMDGLADLGADPGAAIQVLMDIRDANALEGSLITKEKLDAIKRSSLEGNEKAHIFYGLLAGEKEKELMDSLKAIDADTGAVTDALIGMREANALEGSEGTKAKYDAIAKAALTDEEKVVLVGSIMGTDLLTENGGITLYAKFRYAIQNGMSVEQYVAYRNSGADIDKYLELRDAGHTVEDAMDTGIALKELMDNVEDPTSVQKWRTVIDSTDDLEKQMISLAIVMTDSQYRKLKVANGFGIEPGAYVKINELLPKYDVNGNGSYTQAEVTEAVNAMKATKEQKAVLWQVLTGSSSAKNNPYSTNIGQQVIDALKAAKEKESEPSRTFEEEIMRQLMGG